MLLRRVMEHVRAQNWMAVGIDFVIVVAGVFIGIQVSNWNASRSEQTEFDLARERFLAESRSNLETLESIDFELRERLSVVRAAFDALRSCVDTDENRLLVSRGLWRITGTTGVNLRMSALREITEAPHLSSRLTADERRQLDDLKFAMTVLKREANWAEDLPLRERPANNPLVAVGDLEKLSGTYNGIELSGERRNLELAVSVSEACRDDKLTKSFYHWERWQEQVLRYTVVQTTMITSSIGVLSTKNARTAEN